MLTACSIGLIHWVEVRRCRLDHHTVFASPFEVIGLRGVRVEMHCDVANLSAGQGINPLQLDKDFGIAANFGAELLKFAYHSVNRHCGSAFAWDCHL